MTGARNTRSRRMQWAALALAVGLAGAIAVLSLKPPGDGGGFPGLDKLQHAGAYACLALSAGLAGGVRWWARVGLLLVAYGAALEGLQGLMPWPRFPSGLDALANTAGVAAGLALALRLTRSREG